MSPDANGALPSAVGGASPSTAAALDPGVPCTTLATETAPPEAVVAAPRTDPSPPATITNVASHKNVSSDTKTSGDNSHIGDTATNHSHNTTYNIYMGHVDPIDAEKLSLALPVPFPIAHPLPATVRPSVAPSGDAKATELELNAMPAWHRTLVCIASILPDLTVAEFNVTAEFLLQRYPPPTITVVDSERAGKQPKHAKGPSPHELWLLDPYGCLRDCGLGSSEEGIVFLSLQWRDKASEFFHKKAWASTLEEIRRLAESDLVFTGSSNQRRSILQQVAIAMKSDISHFGGVVLSAFTGQLAEVRFQTLAEPASRSDSELIDAIAAAFEHLCTTPKLETWVPSHLGELLRDGSDPALRRPPKVALVHAIFRMNKPEPTVRLAWLLGILETADRNDVIEQMTAIAVWSWLDDPKRTAAVWSHLARELATNTRGQNIRRLCVKISRRQVFASILQQKNDEGSSIMAAFLDPQRRNGNPADRKQLLSAMVLLTLQSDGFTSSVLEAIEDDNLVRTAKARSYSIAWMRERAEAFARCVLITAVRTRTFGSSSGDGAQAFLLRVVDSAPDANWTRPVLAWLVSRDGDFSTSVVETLLYDLTLTVARQPAGRREDAAERGGRTLASLLQALDPAFRRIAYDYLTAIGAATRTIMGDARRANLQQGHEASQVFTMLSSLGTVLSQTVPTLLRSFSSCPP